MLELTEQAQKAIQRFAEGADTPVNGLRVSVVDGGCSGMQYAMSLEAEPQENDVVISAGETKVFVEENSVDVLKGTTIDFVDSLEGSGFTFTNPNAAQSCGCGKSFAA